jgi:hypothetical protein
MVNISKPTLGDINQKKILVISHERSGTHFLMNTLALNFGYISKPWINIDYELGLNLYSANILLSFFRQMHEKPILNIVKTHHQAGFYIDFIDYLTDQFHVFYIYRDPRDVMLSFWKMISGLSWDEGPKVSSVGEFMRAAPRGGNLRYQKMQTETMLSWWQAHVEGWADVAEIHAGQKIMMLSFESLNLDFDGTVKNIGNRIGHPVATPVCPSKEVNVVRAGPGKTGGHRDFFTQSDHDFVLDSVGSTMKRLGIPI